MKKSTLLLIASITSLSTQASTPSYNAIASANQYATEAGEQVIQKGGNAFDAAIAVASTLAVAEPYNSGLGGGGFILIYDAKNDKYQFIDAREVAPIKANSHMFDDNKAKAVNGPLAAAIPGEVAGLIYLSDHYAKLSLQQDLQPAISTAKNGYPVTDVYQKRAKFRLKALQAYQQTSEQYLQGNQIPKAGYMIRQPNLANSLQTIADSDGKAFYQGSIAKNMVKAVDDAGGVWQLDDLKNYKVTIRKPLVGYYKENKVITAPPPSAGGIALLTMFNLMQESNYFSLSEIQKKHHMIEFMRYIYFDRYQYLGDPSFTKIPLQKLTSKHHAKEILTKIKPDQASIISVKPIAINEGMHTTHFSIIDKQGNIVSATLSLNYPFGSGFVAGNTGIILNDHMDDFATQIDQQNVYGLLGGKNNIVEAGKKPLSSMTPTIIRMPNKTIVLGTPGGSKIVTMIMLATTAALSGADAEQIVSLPRYHMQFYPNEVEYEAKAFGDPILNALHAMGYVLTKVKSPYGNMQVVMWDQKNNQITAASDPREEGKALVF